MYFISLNYYVPISRCVHRKYLGGCTEGNGHAVLALLPEVGPVNPHFSCVVFIILVLMVDVEACSPIYD